ncbi:MAG: 50S ribosomal protein L32 [Chloroflexi bacterium]|nr:50S ribosomal protein L32 [Chloroflexota bacterium]
MTEQKRKTSRSKIGRRRSHMGYTAPNLSPCPQCHTPKPPHLVCPVCGTYKGREVYEVKKAKG